MKRPASLPHLCAFEAAARLESFSAAAQELCLTTGAISRHIRSLESQLGVTLFSRGHKIVRLTEAGETFARTAGRLLAELAAAERAVSRQAERKHIRVDSLPTFAMHWLMPKLAAFNEAHPDITVSVTTSTDVINRRSAFDVAIRRDTAHFGGLTAQPFLEEQSVLVCSTDYLQDAALERPAELGGHTLIHIRAREDLWPKWYSHYGIDSDLNTRTLWLDHTFAAIQAAEDGLGLAFIPSIFCEKRLAEGRLVAPFSKERLKTGVYSVLKRSTDNGIADNFISWLKN
ncbi:LysR substrate-binding domain-containing protein [Cronobacter malonaticus]